MNEAMVAGYVQIDWQEMQRQIAEDAQKALLENEEWASRIRESRERDAEIFGLVLATPFLIILLAAILCH
ncbi:hypothetical protein AB4Y43_01345 [Paraburkholderia sp. BR10872]|uniref:hypothetical protein n=1 Tax=Paraburkholderia sp. BR10872 TaxID=3236989 RepID=UPI0034D31A1A